MSTEAPAASEAQGKKVKKNVQTGIAHITADVQQHDRHHHRRLRERGRLVVGRACGLQGLAQVDAVRRAARRRGRRPQGAWSTACSSVTVFVKGPGAGRESALRALAAAGLQDQPDPRRHPHPPQRLPAAQAAPRLITLHSREASRHPWRILRSCLPALPARRHEAVPQGRPLLHRQVRLRAAPLPARPARPGPAAQALRLRRAAAREAEGQAHLRPRRAAVPRLLLQGGRA